MSSENKTAAGVLSERAKAAQESGAGCLCTDGLCPGCTEVMAVLEDAANLPPAPLPADVAALIAKAVDWARRMNAQKAGPTTAEGYELAAEGQLIAHRLAALAQPAAPMTEAEQADEAGKRG